ncbi:heavy-metal-associated domain-containing protein [Labilibaculum sp.]|uniref:heavy-metal-associated domain-containing protein n=1 Tax=Labilibaculum sp. TaxID=2060723 RepID=UPI003566583E
MKKRILFVAVIFSLISLSFTAKAEVKKASFKVSGNCGMCEKTIESAAKAVEGVLSADWDKKTKKMVLSFDTEKTTLHAVHKAIASVGYDTDKVKANDDVYSRLHSCCKYERE